MAPGETQLEVDRRRVLRRVTKLEQELKDLAKTRRTQAKSRQRGRNRLVSIVGYTNAGKSTLLNRLTDAGVLVEDRLFATLDPRIRRLDLPGGEAVLLSDTVGFVRKLPHMLVEAFRSTLEVAAQSDLLIHVVDASAPDPEAQIDAVRTVLTEIDADGVPQLVAFNKIDRTDARASASSTRHPGSVAISALTGEGVDDLLAVLSDRLRALETVVELLVPYERGDVRGRPAPGGRGAHRGPRGRRHPAPGPPRPGRHRAVRGLPGRPGPMTTRHDVVRGGS